MKKIIILLLLITVIIMGNNDASDLSKGLNKIITLRGVEFAYSNIWEQLGVTKSTKLYFNGDDNLYKCNKLVTLGNTNCSKVNIDENFSIDTNFNYIYNYSGDFTSKNNYVLSEDELNNLYNDWEQVQKNISSFNENYKELGDNMNKALSLSNIYSTYGSEWVQILPYDVYMLALTNKVLNDLNIRVKKDDDISSLDYDYGVGLRFFNLNNKRFTDFSCELYKLTGKVPENVRDNFTTDSCDLENTFYDNDNILRVEKRVFYQKTKPKDNSNLYFDKDSEAIKEKEYNGNGNSNLNIVLNPSLEISSQLTDEWSDDIIVNLYILRKAVLGTDDILANIKFLQGNLTNRHLWELTASFINKKFQFYEKKAKAKARIKQLMELKSIGLLNDIIWNNLGFNSFKNDVKSEITVNEVFDKYNDVINYYKSIMNGKYTKELLDNNKLNILFLAKLLKKLDLKMVNGKIFNDYNAEYIKALLQMENYTQFESYKSQLRVDKNNLISNLSSKEEKSLIKYFEMKESFKLLDVLKTHGITKTIPEFKNYLQNKENGILADYYASFTNKLIKIIDDYLVNKDDETYLEKIRANLYTSSLKLLGSLEYTRGIDLKELYNKLDDISLIIDSSVDYNEIKKAIIDEKEVDVLSFKYLALKDYNLLYDNDETNLYYLYNPYSENKTDENEIKNLISDTITIIINDKLHGRAIKTNILKDIKDYAELSNYLADISIEAHHARYDLIAQMIKNLSLSVSQGIDYSEWVEFANEKGMQGSDIWELLAIDKSASLSQNSVKNIDIDKILENFSKFNKIVKEKFGLSVNLYDDNFTYNSLFFDPITAMILSKVLVEKGYYIDSDEDGNDAVFDKNGIKINLSMKIDAIIDDIKNRYDLFGNDFNNLFNNSSLNGFLNNLGTQNSADLDKMMQFINFSYTKDLRTGEMNVAFTFGMGEIQDDILWKNIRSSVGNVSSFVVDDIAIFLIATSISYVLTKAVETAYFDDGDYALRNLSDEQIWELSKSIAIMVYKDGKTYYQVKEVYKGSYEYIVSEYNKLAYEYRKLTNKVRDLTKKLKNDPNNEKLKKELANAEKERKRIQRLEEQKQREKMHAEDRKRAAEYLLKVKKNKMCRPDAYSEKCDAGVSPAGMTKLMHKMPKKLLEEINKRIRKIPPRECNVITKTCDGNSIEINAGELKNMINSIQAEENADDGACIWSPMGECNFFNEVKIVPSYIDLLWDPLPPFVEQ